DWTHHAGSTYKVDNTSTKLIKVRRCSKGLDLAIPVDYACAFILSKENGSFSLCVNRQPGFSQSDVIEFQNKSPGVK
ncbi:MAG: hypothetical protein Q9183_006627, partial [Haloplaca sp. 2 TL-2023]